MNSQTGTSGEEDVKASEHTALPPPRVHQSQSWNRGSVRESSLSKSLAAGKLSQSPGPVPCLEVGELELGIPNL